MLLRRIHRTWHRTVAAVEKGGEGRSMRYGEDEGEQAINQEQSSYQKCNEESKGTNEEEEKEQ